MGETSNLFFSQYFVEIGSQIDTHKYTHTTRINFRYVLNAFAFNNAGSFQYYVKIYLRVKQPILVESEAFYTYKNG